MPDGGTEDAERLCNVLSSLCKTEQGFSARGRHLSKDSTAQMLAAILQEIDETVLRRLLRFTDDRVGDLVLDVAERRLFGFSIRRAPHLEKDDDAVKEQISIDDPAAVARALQSFCSETDGVHIQTELAQTSLPEGVMGLSTADLSIELFAGSGKTAPPVAIEAVIADCRVFALSIFDSEAADGNAITGQAALGRELQELDAEFGSGKPADHPADADQCVIWRCPAEQTPAILKVHHKGRHLWVAFEADQLDACISCWSVTMV